MSIVSSYISPEAEAALKRQRRVSTVSSIFVSFLVVVLIGLIMAFILLPSFFIETASVVAYSTDSPKEEKIEKPETTTQVKRNPSAPSSSMAKVIASTTPTPTSIPVPEVNVPDPSVDFGNGDDFGEGWGDGNGSGGGGGGTTFFGQTSKAERIAYVIDYSASMGGPRQELMRKELSDSLEKIPYSTEFQMIFFAGPAWVGGFEVKMGKGKKEVVVKGEKGHNFDWKCNGGAHG